MRNKVLATLLIATPSPLMQRGLAEVVRELPEILVVGQAGDALGTLQKVQELRPELLVLERSIARELVMLPGLGEPRPRVLLLSSQQHPGASPDRERDCACGFFRDCASAEDVHTILQVVAQCDVRSGTNDRCERCPAHSTLRLPNLPLSERELQVFERIGQGQGSSVIAGALGVSVKTIETYRESIKRKLGLDSGHGLLRAAILWQLGHFVPDDRPPPLRR